MPLANPYRQYQVTAAQTADGTQLLVMSYEAILRWLSRAEAAIDENNIESAHTGLISAQDIIKDLLWNLDAEKGGDVAANLKNLYEYFLRELIWANIYKDKERIAHVKDLVTPLLDAWRVAVVKFRREGRQAGATDAARFTANGVA